MWVLYSIKRNGKGFRDALVSRLRPSQTYLILKRGKYDPEFTASIILGEYPLERVENIRSKPKIVLKQIKSRKVEALVADKTVNNEHSLFDEDIIRVSSHDTRYRIRWESFTIFVDNVADEEYQYLKRLGAMLGIHVVKEWSKHITHIYISEEPQEEISSAIIRGLALDKFFITKKWIQNAKFELQSQDRTATLKALNESIETIVWENFGLAKQSARLGHDDRRSTLFEEMEFIIADSTQFKQLAPLIECCGGSSIYVDINSGESVNFNHKSHLVQIPDSSDIDTNEWNSLLTRYMTETGNARQIWDVEIGWAIVYTATNYMCNPASSMGSVILSVDADKKEYPSCSVHTTLPNNSVSSSADETKVRYKQEEDSVEHNTIQATVPYNPDEATMPYDADQATVPYDPDQATVPYDSNQPSMPYHPGQATVPYNPNQASVLDSVDEKDDHNQHSCSTRHETSERASFEREVTPVYRQKTQAQSVSETASMYETAPVNETTSTHEENTSAHTTSDKYTPVRETSPIREMSPIAPISPVRETFPDVQAPSPLSSVSPEPEISNYGASMDSDASLPDRMTDLNDFFNDVVGTIKAKPPPRKTPAPTNVDQKLDYPEVTYSSPPLNAIKDEPLVEPSLNSESSSSVPQASLNASETEYADQPSSTSGMKRSMSTTDTPRLIKRKKVITEEEEQAEEEADDTKMEPATPPKLSETTDSSNSNNTMETQREEQIGVFSKVIYAPLVVHRQPSSNSTVQTNSRNRSGVNYKRFKKVKQFEYENEMDIVYMVNSSQISREQLQQQRRSTTRNSGTRIENTDIFDPDIFIRSVRRIG